jgi:hypothetical protein
MIVWEWCTAVSAAAQRAMTPSFTLQKLLRQPKVNWPFVSAGNGPTSGLSESDA